MKHSRKHSRLFSLLLTLCLVFGFSSLTAFAEESEQPSQQTLTTVTNTGLDLRQNTPDVETTYQAGSGTITFTPATNASSAVVTLNNASIDVTETKNAWTGLAALALPEGAVTLVIPEGTTSTLSSMNSFDECNAIYAEGTQLTITGSGVLNLNANADVIDCYYDGSLAVNTTTLNLHSIDGNGVYSEYDIALTNSTVSAEIAENHSSSYPNGLDSTDGSIILNHASYTAKYFYYAISAENCGALILTDGSYVNSTGCTGGVNVYPNDSSDSTLKNTIQNSTLLVNARKTAFVSEGTTLIENSTVTLISETDTAFDQWFGELNLTGNTFLTLSSPEGRSALDLQRSPSGVGITLADNLHVFSGEISENTMSSTSNLYIAPSATVTFDSMGGSAVDPILLAAGSTISENAPANPTRTGYTFSGWFADVACTVAWDLQNAPVENSMTLYAGWTPISSTIHYDSDGGSLDTASGTFSYGQPIGTLPTPTKDGYTFVGWFDEHDQQVTESTFFLTTDEVTIHAKWTVNTPEKPETPETPATPTTPETPAKPELPDTSAPATGDTSLLGLWMALLAASGCGLAALVYGKKTVKNK